MVRCKELKTYLMAFLILFFFLAHTVVSFVEGSDTNKIKIAIFPFNDIQSKSFDIRIPAVLDAELSKNEFIESVLVEVDREKIYEIEPSFLWTEKEDDEKIGGILWKIEPRVVEGINKRVSAEFSIYGDLTRFGNKWMIDVNIKKEKDLRPKKSFTISGLKDEEIPERLKEVAKNIIDWLRNKNVLSEAEEDIRRYMGGLYTYAAVIEKITNRVDSFPESIPLRALLLDLYLKEKEMYHNEIMNEGLKIISLYDPSREEDTRYLLSISIDPFDTTAEIYEEERAWENAIEIRNKAMKLFPYRAENHKKRLGRDYYFFALSFEKRGQNEKALENYKRAMTYLQQDSGYFKAVVEGLERLRDK